MEDAGESQPLISSLDLEAQDANRISVDQVSASSELPMRGIPASLLRTTMDYFGGTIVELTQNPAGIVVKLRKND